MLVGAPAMSGAVATAVRRGTTLVNIVPSKTLWSVGTAWRRGAVLVDAPPMSGAVVTAVSIMSESRGGIARLLDTMVLRCDGGTVLLFVWRERFDWGGSIRLDCPGSIGLSRFDWTPGQCCAGQTPNRTF